MESNFLIIFTGKCTFSKYVSLRRNLDGPDGLQLSNFIYKKYFLSFVVSGVKRLQERNKY